MDVMERSFKECLDNALYCPDRFFPFELMIGLDEVIRSFQLAGEIKKSFQGGELSSFGMLHVSQVLLSGAINQEKVRSWLDQQFRLEYGYDSEEAMARVWLTQMKPLNFGLDDGIVDFFHEQYAIYWMCSNHPDDLKVLLSAIEKNCDKIEDHKLFDDFGNKSINMRQEQIQEKLCSTVEYMKFWMKKLDVPLKESTQSISHPFKSPHHGYYFPIVVP
ncbi:hypothetical protein ACWJJH_11575 [Endozoicomonadaceae bacterium StTr2]